MDTVILFNPAACNGRAARRRAEIEAAFGQGTPGATVRVTTRPGQARQWAAEVAPHCDRLIAVGGDGTLHEVVNGVMDGVPGFSAAGRPVIGIVPQGTGNDVAGALGMPREVKKAADALRLSRALAIDLGWVRWQDSLGTWRERVFINCLGVGFDAVAAMAASKTKYFKGQMAYLAGILRSLPRWRSAETQCRVTLQQAVDPVNGIVGDGHRSEEVVHDGSYLLIETQNGPRIGGGFPLAPQASFTDGLLDMCSVQAMSVARVLRILPIAMRGRHGSLPEVSIRQGARFRIEATGEAPLPIQADGEVLEPAGRVVEIEVRPAAVRMVAPGLSGS